MSQRCLIARLGAERVALPIETIALVIDAPIVEPVPLAPPALAGHLAHGGQRLPLLQASVLFGIARGDAAGVAILLRQPSVALWMDDADDVWEFSPAELQPAPTARDRPAVLGGLLQRGSAVIGVVDSPALAAAIAASLQES